MSNPYASELTMPDGTTRGALIERKPELRPRRTYLSEGYLCWDNCHEQVAGDVALACCRMAAMDWLRERTSLEFWTLDNGEHCCVQSDSDGDMNLLVRGRDDDKALAIACHMRLDAEEVK